MYVKLMEIVCGDQGDNQILKCDCFYHQNWVLFKSSLVNQTTKVLVRTWCQSLRSFMQNILFTSARNSRDSKTFCKLPTPVLKHPSTCTPESWNGRKWSTLRRARRAGTSTAKQYTPRSSISSLFTAPKWAIPPNFWPNHRCRDLEGDRIQFPNTKDFGGKNILDHFLELESDQ